MQPSGIFNVRYEQDTAIVRTGWQWGLLIALLLFLLLFPFFARPFLLSTVISLAIITILVLGLNIVTGYCGQLSLGQAAFMAVGSYASVILMSQWGVSFWIALPFAGLFSALVGLLFGLPAVRIKGFYLVMSTIAAHFIVIWLITERHLAKLTGGVDGLLMPLPRIGGFVIDTDFRRYFLILSIAVLLTFFVRNLARTKTGRAFVAIRDNDKAAEAMGVSLFRYKLLAFALSAFYAGIAGALWAVFVSRIHPEQFTLMDSIWYLGMLIVGGMGSTLGAILGTSFLKLLKEGVTLAAPWVAKTMPTLIGAVPATMSLVVFGLVIILFLVFEPRGLAHRWEIFKRYYRLWPFSY